MGADITGDLICSGAQLNDTDSDRNALVAGGMKVGGSVYLDQLDGPFTATGAVWLARADIASDLACSGAQLGKNRDGIGLLADGIRVGVRCFSVRDSLPTGRSGCLARTSPAILAAATLIWAMTETATRWSPTG